MEKFTLKKEHILLLKNAYISWQDREFGAPEINPKRPYGNSNVISDIAEILGLELFEDCYGEKHLSKEQYEYTKQLHKETMQALQIILKNHNVQAGEYEID